MERAMMPGNARYDRRRDFERWRWIFGPDLGAGSHPTGSAAAPRHTRAAKSSIPERLTRSRAPISTHGELPA
jgi:hypothetical protein